MPAGPQLYCTAEGVPCVGQDGGLAGNLAAQVRTTARSQQACWRPLCSLLTACFLLLSQAPQANRWTQAHCRLRSCCCCCICQGASIAVMACNLIWLCMQLVSRLLAVRGQPYWPLHRECTLRVALTSGVLAGQRVHHRHRAGHGRLTGNRHWPTGITCL